MTILAKPAVDKYSSVVTAYICGSMVEGYANGYSDLDVFILTDGAPAAPIDNDGAASFELDDFRIDTEYEQNVRLDIECWDMKQVCDIIDRINACATDPWTAPYGIEPRWFQLLHGIRIGFPVVAASAFSDLREAADWKHVSHLLYCRFMLQYTGSQEDAAGALIAHDHGTALLASRVALESSVDALIAASGSTSIKSKWRFAKLRAHGLNKIAEKYLEAELDRSGDADDILAAAKNRLHAADDIAHEANRIMEQAIA